MCVWNNQNLYNMRWCLQSTVCSSCPFVWLDFYSHFNYCEKPFIPSSCFFLFVLLSWGLCFVYQANCQVNGRALASCTNSKTILSSINVFHYAIHTSLWSSEVKDRLIWRRVSFCCHESTNGLNQQLHRILRIFKVSKLLRRYQVLLFHRKITTADWMNG